MYRMSILLHACCTDDASPIRCAVASLGPPHPKLITPDSYDASGVYRVSNEYLTVRGRRRATPANFPKSGGESEPGGEILWPGKISRLQRPEPPSQLARESPS